MTTFTATHPSEYAEFATRHRLPPSYATLVDSCFMPAIEWLHERRKPGTTFLLGVNGAQGTGKSTLADLIQLATGIVYDWNVAVVSIDDFYRTRAERHELARERHPLLATRGVPGTHDVGLLETCIDTLVNLAAGESAALPRFDKSIDDRLAPSSWPKVTGPLDLVILEGWCVGTPAQPKADLSAPVNDLERDEDADGRWRGYVNAVLASDYEPVFRRLNALYFLRAPHFEAVYRWRLEQERKLALDSAQDAPGIMSDAEVRRFIAHYERLTRWNLERLGTRADIVFELDDSHAVSGVEYH